MFTKKNDERIKWIFLIVVLLFLIIFFKIVYVQVFSYDKLSTHSDYLWSRELPISALRGKMLDRNGEGKGIIFDVGDVKDLELATTSFVQGVSLTSLHLTV